MALLPELAAGSHVLVLNGDTLTDLDFAGLVRRHAASGAAASLVVVRRTTTVEFGVIDIGPNGELVDYVEKPSYEYQISIGINAFRAETMAQLPHAVHLDMPDFLMAVKRAGLPVACVESDCFWLDLGRIDDLRTAADLAEQHPERFALE